MMAMLHEDHSSELAMLLHEANVKNLSLSPTVCVWYRHIKKIWILDNIYRTWSIHFFNLVFHHSPSPCSLYSSCTPICGSWQEVSIETAHSSNLSRLFASTYSTCTQIHSLSSSNDRSSLFHIRVEYPCTVFPL